MLAPLSDNARNLIFKFEDLGQPGQWPGGESGVTIGIGYDLGFATAEQFRSDWADCLTDGDCAALTAVLGQTGQKAKASAPALKSIVIKRADAERVSTQRSEPKAQAETEAAFPGVGIDEQAPVDFHCRVGSEVNRLADDMLGLHELVIDVVLRKKPCDKTCLLTSTSGEKPYGHPPLLSRPSV